MIHRKVLYGYRIQDGALKIVPEEQQTVRRIFTLYNAGASYQRISDALNRDKIPYCVEAPLWNKHKVKRLLENPRYTGKDGYPEIVDRDTFQMAKNKIAEKNTGRKSSDDKSPLARLTPYFRCACGGKLMRIGGKWQNSTMLYLKCRACESSTTMDMTETVDEIVRQFRTHERPKQTDYIPSAEVICLQAGFPGSGNGVDPAGSGSPVRVLPGVTAMRGYGRPEGSGLVPLPAGGLLYPGHAGRGGDGTIQRG